MFGLAGGIADLPGDLGVRHRARHRVGARWWRAAGDRHRRRAVRGPHGADDDRLDHIVAGRDANLVLRTTVRQPGGASGGFVDVYAPLELPPSFWGALSAATAGLPHDSHFRGPQQPRPGDLRPGSHRRLGPAQRQRHDHHRQLGQIDGAYVIHLGNVIATRVGVPFNGATRFAADPAGGGRFTLFTAATTPLNAAGIEVGRNLSIKDSEGARRLDRAGPGQRLDAADQRAGLDRDGRCDPGRARRQRRRPRRPRRDHRRPARRPRPVADRRRPAAVRHGSILDGDASEPKGGTDPQDVEGVNIGLAAAGATSARPRTSSRSTSSTRVNGVAAARRASTATAGGGAYLEEVAGDLRVVVRGHRRGRRRRAADSDAVLVARAGAHLRRPGRRRARPLRQPPRLMAAAGIGLITNALEINSSTNGRSAAVASTPPPAPASTSSRRRARCGCWRRPRSPATSSSPCPT